MVNFAPGSPANPTRAAVATMPDPAGTGKLDISSPSARQTHGDSVRRVYRASRRGQRTKRIALPSTGPPAANHRPASTAVSGLFRSTASAGRYRRCVGNPRPRHPGSYTTAIRPGNVGLTDCTLCPSSNTALMERSSTLKSPSAVRITVPAARATCKPMAPASLNGHSYAACPVAESSGFHAGEADFGDAACQDTQ